MTTHASDRWKRLGWAALFVVGCELVGVTGALLTVAGEGSWYADLAKPWFTPPNWLFGPVWTVLYALMGVAAYLVWQARRDAKVARSTARRALTLFAAQLALNGVWTPVFFGAHQIAAGALVISSLVVVLALTARAFSAISKLAGWLLVPYLAWAAYAAALNLSIWALN